MHVLFLYFSNTSTKWSLTVPCESVMFPHTDLLFNSSWNTCCPKAMINKSVDMLGLKLYWMCVLWSFPFQRLPRMSSGVKDEILSCEMWCEGAVEIAEYAGVRFLQRSRWKKEMAVEKSLDCFIPGYWRLSQVLMWCTWELHLQPYESCQVQIRANVNCGAS